jgi:hypothetical protein
VLEKNMIRLVVILLAATNAERSIVVAHRVADAERAAVPCAVQGANWGWKAWRGQRGSYSRGGSHKERWKREKFAKISVYLSMA